MASLRLPSLQILKEVKKTSNVAQIEAVRRERTCALRHLPKRARAALGMGRAHESCNLAVTQRPPRYQPHGRKYRLSECGLCINSQALRLPEAMQLWWAMSEETS